MSDRFEDLLTRLDKAHAEEKKFRLESFGVRDYDPDESTLHSEAAEAIRELIAVDDGTLELKVGDKVQLQIRWLSHSEGSVGIVEGLSGGEYPINVKLVGRASVVGFARHELRKV